MNRNTLVLVVAALACLASGCAGLTLKHTPMPPSAQFSAPVKLVVINSREEQFGGAEEFVVGRTRNLYGMPIKTKSDNSMMEALRSLFTDALRSRGYQVVENSPVVVEVDVRTFFMDGYGGYKLDAAFEMRVVANGAVAYSSPFQESHGFAFMRSRDLANAYDHFMDKIAASASALVDQDGFRNAVLSAAGSPATDPAPPAL